MAGTFRKFYLDSAANLMRTVFSVATIAGINNPQDICALGGNRFLVASSAVHLGGGIDDFVFYCYWDGTNLRLLKTIITQFNADDAGTHHVSVTFDGKYIYFQRIVLSATNPANILYKMDWDGNVIYSFTVSNRMRKICMMGNKKSLNVNNLNNAFYLCQTNATNTQIQVNLIRETDDKIAKLIALSGITLSGITFDGRYFYVSATTNTIQRVNFNGNIISSFLMPFGTQNEGITWDGRYLYGIDNV